MRSCDEYDVKIGIEPLNRAETSLVNTVKQGMELIQKVDKYNWDWS